MTQLTIDTRHLGDLFVPAFREESDAVVELDRQCAKAYRVQDRSKPATLRRFTALNRARTLVSMELDRTVETIRGRGGLLLCVA